MHNIHCSRTANKISGKSVKFESYVDIIIQNMPGARTAKVTLLDRNHGSSLSEWLAMGKPNFPTREQQQKLREAAVLPPPEVRNLDPKNPNISLQLDEHELALIQISPGK